MTRLGAVVVAAALLLAGCGGSSKPKATTAPTTSATSATSSAGSALTGDAGSIKQLYSRLVDLTVPVAQKVDLVQDGADFLDAMTALSKNPQAQNIGLQVSDVKLVHPDLADVTYTILASGSPLLANQHGYAVKQNGTWKVSGLTLCGLLSAQDPTHVPPACSKPAATALPTS